MMLRPAEPADTEFLTALYAHDDVRPFLAAAGSYDRDAIVARIEHSQREPDAGGIVVIDVDGTPAGAMAWERVNQRSRIAHVGGVAVHPDFRGRRIADDAARLLQRELIHRRGFHRLQLEIYGFNERALRHAERSGFVREGVKRKAYRHENEWVDGVLFAVVAEDLEDAQ